MGRQIGEVRLQARTSLTAWTGRDTVFKRAVASGYQDAPRCAAVN